MGIYYGEDRIGIDCGSGYPQTPDSELCAYGRLACLRLDDGKEFYSEESFPGESADYSASQEI